MRSYILDFAELTIAEINAGRGHWDGNERFVLKQSAAQIVQSEIDHLHSVVFRLPVLLNEFLFGQLFPTVIGRILELGWAKEIPVALVTNYDIWFCQAGAATEPFPGEMFIAGYSVRWTSSYPL